jgi:hypothetical protein
MLSIDPPSAQFWVAQDQQGPPAPNNEDVPPGLPFTIKNTGGATVSEIFLGIIDEKDPNSFRISQNGCTAGLAAGDTCQILVAFGPHKDGATSAKLIASTDKSLGSGATADLIGHGTLSKGGLLIEPPMQNVPDVGANGTIFSFQVKNIGSTFFQTVTLSVQPPTTEAPPEFVILPPPRENPTDFCTGGSLAPNQECTVKVRFVPNSLFPGGRTNVLTARAQLDSGADAGEANATMFANGGGTI